MVDIRQTLHKAERLGVISEQLRQVLEKIATTPTEGPDRPVKRMNIESIKIVPADSVK